MTENNGTLGILVNSNQHLEYVLKLSEAAAGKGKRVVVHILGPGVAGLYHHDFLAGLSRIAQVTVCADSMRRFACQGCDTMPKAVTIVPSGQLAHILGRCDRHVVF